MGFNSPNWVGLLKMAGRGYYTTNSDDPLYHRHFNVVEGSLEKTTSDELIGKHHPAAGRLRSIADVNLRRGDDTYYLDTVKTPEAPTTIFKPFKAIVEHGTIQPVAIPADEVRVSGPLGHRRVEIPDQYGGGYVLERSGAIRGRPRDAPAKEQLRDTWSWLTGK